jgi:cation transport regulator ChaB
MPYRTEDLPSTLQRSPRKAQETYAKAMQAAEEEYGSGERAARTAWAAVKHSFQKVGDHWEPKERRGPSDSRAAQPQAKARQGVGRTYGGVNVAGQSKEDLYDEARRLGVKGRSSMSKAELAEALRKASDRETAKSRARKR